jgi:uracil-DNA glycosylase family 4
MCEITEEGLLNVRTAAPLECGYEFINNPKFPEMNEGVSRNVDVDLLRKRMSLCDLCPASRDRLAGPILPEGNLDSKFAVVLRNPLSIDTPYTGYMRGDSNYAQVFHLYLKVLGIPRSELYITGALLCSVPDERVPTFEENRGCGGLYKEYEINLLKKVRVIFLMGEDALKQFVDPRLTIKTNWSDNYFIPKTPATYLLPILHVGTYLNNPDQQKNILKHLLTLRKRFVDPVKKGLL